jgi:diguanylate cyclase (GGDEF)-like protein/PAS domain S-box-containing protein
MDSAVEQLTPIPPHRTERHTPGTPELKQLLSLQRDLMGRIALNDDLTSVLNTLCGHTQSLLNGIVLIYRYDPASERLVLFGDPELPATLKKALRYQKVTAEGSLWSRCAFNREPQYELASSGTPDKQLISLHQHGYQGGWAYPILNSDQQLLGCCAVIRSICGSPSPYEAQILENAAHIVSIALAKDVNEKNLQHSENRFRQLTDAIPGVVLQIELDDHQKPILSFISRRAKSLMKDSLYEPHALNGLLESMHPKDRSTLESLLRTQRHEEVLWTHAFRFINEDTARWLLFSFTPEWQPNGKLSKLNAIALDVTDQARTRIELELAGVAFEATNEGILITDTNNQIVRVNRAYCEMSGYNQDELLGQTPQLLNAGLIERRQLQDIQSALQLSGTWQGEVWSRRKDGARYPQWVHITLVHDQDEQITHVVNVAADLSNQKESEARLKYLAQNDPLTDLPNREMLRARVQDTIQEGAERFAILMLDLDRFKYINETFGHATGDLLLKQIAHRLQVVLKRGELLARIGADEFMILKTPCLVTGDAKQRAAAIFQALEAPFTLNGQSIYVGACIGIACYPEHGGDSSTLLKNTETALHKAKEQGRNNFACYRKEHSTMVEEWIRLEYELRKALQDQEFRVFFQPQIDAITGQLSGMEALLRWQHPERGLLAPNAFLEVLEEIGLMSQVGDWVIEQVCQQLVSWRGTPLEHTRIAVNLAARQILHHDLVGWVETMQERYQITPEQLEFEIVENLMVKHQDEVTPVLNRLRALGFKLALDDFGTGYSSLSYLKMLPVHKVKIDRSLVRDIPNNQNDEAIAKAVILLSHSMDLLVCAEGVESSAHQQFLRKEGCDQLQGYLFSKPIPSIECLPWFDEHFRRVNR